MQQAKKHRFVLVRWLEQWLDDKIRMGIQRYQMASQWSAHLRVSPRPEVRSFTSGHLEAEVITISCWACKKQIEASARYCKYCGKLVRAAPKTVAAPPATATDAMAALCKDANVRPFEVYTMMKKAGKRPTQTLRWEDR